MSRQSSNGPVRSCVGCGGRRAKQELVRFTLKEGALYPDYPASGRGSGDSEGSGGSVVAGVSRGTGQGRGAYLCYDKGCFLKAFKKNAFSRAFKTQFGLTGTGASHAEAKPLKEAAYEVLWQVVAGKLSKTGKIKEVKLKG